jgi:hypothetical protein
VAGAHHHDERSGRIALGEGHDVTAPSNAVRAEDGAARVFPIGVGSLESQRPIRGGSEDHGQ